MSTIITDLISHLQCGEAISANDAIYIDDVSGKIFKYDVTDDTQVFAGIAKEAGVLDEFVRVVQSGRVKGFTGLTAGAFVYASTTTPGGFQTLDPGAASRIILGIAKSATELVINGGLGIKPGGEGSGGGLDVYYTEDMEGLNDVSDFSTGNNAAFLGGGTMQGTLDIEDVAPISGTKSLSYTQAVGSLNDYFASELIDIDLKQQNNDSGMTLYFQYDGNDDDLKFVVYDVTNGAELTSGVELVKVTDKAQRYALSFYVPVTCDEIRWGAQVLVENIGAVLLVDDVEITSNPFVYKDLVDPRTVVRAEGTLETSVDADVDDIDFIGVDDEYGLWNGTQFNPFEEGDYLVSGMCYSTSNETDWDIQAYIDGVGNVELGKEYSNSHTRVKFQGIIHLEEGEILSFRSSNSFTPINDITRHYVTIIRIPESTEHVITPAKSTPAVVRGAGNGGESITANVTDIPFTEVEDDLGIWDGDSYTAPSDGNYIVSGSILASTNDLGRLDAYVDGSVRKETLGHNKTPSTRIDFNGIITLSAGEELSIRSAQGVTVVDDSTAHHIHIQKISDEASILAAIPTPKTAYIKDVKPSGTAGGTFTSGAWQTRDLNTLEGDTGFVSLSGNQVTIAPGKYKIKASAPAYIVNSHQTRLRNITDSTTDIVGTSEYANDTNLINNRSMLSGTVTLTSSKTFELQHRCATTGTTNGFGRNASFGESEVYSILEIEKIG